MNQNDQLALSKETIEQIKDNDELIRFLVDMKAVVHNTTHRVLELSILTDALIHILNKKGVANDTYIWNLIRYSSHAKDWQVHTGESMTLEDYAKKYLPEDYDLDNERYHVTKFKEDLDKAMEANKNSKN